jgi:hypothetical protein
VTQQSSPKVTVATKELQENDVYRFAPDQRYSVHQGLISEAAEHPSRPRRGFGRATGHPWGPLCRQSCIAARHRFCMFPMSSNCLQCSTMMWLDWRSGSCKERRAVACATLSKLTLKRGRAADADGDDLERAPRGSPQILHSAPSTPLRRACRSVTSLSNLL